MEYNPAMTNLQVQPAAPCRWHVPILRLSSDRPVNDPFVDMILEANWSSGRMVRRLHHAV